ncbi:hypothetical protein [Jatrophihabitans sp.]|uniref:hypothetical protein n=1 Tax=Jatrophihabitans sp. TaxID=1932789 RepID=UPI0030C70816|nr:hypothetical protein [Jatrophihabitans sp.]
MTQADGLDRALVLLSLQRALWDAVTPELRAVSVGWSGGRIDTTFVYDSPISSEMVELVGVVEAEMLADFPSGTETRFDLVHIPRTEDRRDAAREWWAYLRREA